MTKKELNQLQYEIVGAAVDVHRELGPGLLESVYQKCFQRELEDRGFEVMTELPVHIEYKGYSLDADLRCDLLVGDIVIELKAVEKIHPVHSAQLLTYMRLLRRPKGLLINFCSDNLVHSGLKVLVNEYFRNLPE